MNNIDKTIFRLHSNENFYGSTVRVRSGLRSRLRTLSQYPDPPIILERTLAENLRVNPENIVVGGGSVRLIDGLIQSMMDIDQEVITFEQSFVAYAQLASAHRRKIHFAPLTNYICNIRNLIPLVNAKTRIIFIANPNNPTGTIISHAEVRHLLERVPSNVLVVLDEAYGEYVLDPSFPDSIKLQQEFPNLIILRTFSKIYGLAGLRIGYGIMHHELALPLSRNRIPFFFNSLSEEAALIALKDQTFIHRCKRRNAKERERMYSLLKHHDLPVVPSHANFLYLPFNSELVKDEWARKFSSHGLKICDLRIFGLKSSLRIGIGDAEVNRRMKKMLKEAESVTLQSEG